MPREKTRKERNTTFRPPLFFSARLKRRSAGNVAKRKTGTWVPMERSACGSPSSVRNSGASMTKNIMKRKALRARCGL